MNDYSNLAIGVLALSTVVSAGLAAYWRHELKKTREELTETRSQLILEQQKPLLDKLRENTTSFFGHIRG
ncbi:hypothetical protein A2767_00180 [Candidatus Roizmanbacteria bacterium RIFCSPHIGHO2_01_FULL_35_10]|uniref:Uncharacterized protein n=1 Tax=Candidatus Roizmanbacteria bacterium RIFCSPLOWO2_01_FULL_35_13 TaxID=1802055 RepID=A0A1F7IHE2_9BACT|nr:MAG: hypothetical protein A2767_00180 [Candidatus Roizmanbacteria bacterium RIFCSPHIGHO2_01_FULL_35_10]OGK42768.1 MAG: hypothetical protein A3A74_00960 [Candidatus Roizmanbacteria bacterium RIFCSPLOWO2_01_FULL_35_13]